MLSAATDQGVLFLLVSLAFVAVGVARKFLPLPAHLTRPGCASEPEREEGYDHPDIAAALSATSMA